jgi:hypothetical protein
MVGEPEHPPRVREGPRGSDRLRARPIETGDGSGGRDRRDLRQLGDREREEATHTPGRDRPTQAAGTAPAKTISALEDGEGSREPVDAAPSLLARR